MNEEVKKKGLFPAFPGSGEISDNYGMSYRDLLILVVTFGKIIRNPHFDSKRVISVVDDILNDR